MMSSNDEGGKAAESVSSSGGEWEDGGNWGLSYESVSTGGASEGGVEESVVSEESNWTSVEGGGKESSSVSAMWG